MGVLNLKRPSHLAVSLLGFPAILYRAGLGRLLGNRFLLLTHRGRKTGRLYQTPIEVVLFDKSNEEATVISAWGEYANWYRNLEAGGVVKVSIGGRDYEPAVTFHDESQREQRLREFRRRHPLEARIAPFILGWHLRTDDDLRQLARQLRIVTFKPKSA